MSEPDSVIMTQLEIKGCAAVLYLNAVPITRLTPETVAGENCAVQQWLVPGENKLELLVEPGPTPSLARSPSFELERREMTAVARLLKFKEGDDGTAQSGTMLAEVRFEWDAEKPNTLTFPQSVFTSTQLGSSFGPWAWQSYPDLVLDQSLIDEAQAILLELDAAVRGNHADRIWQLTELQMLDTARAYPALTEAYLRADITDMLQVFGVDGDPTLPRDPANQDFRLVAGAKLLELCDKDFRPSFRLRDRRRGQIVPFPTFLARVGKDLRIVR